jgi:hypothetical protein
MRSRSLRSRSFQNLCGYVGVRVLNANAERTRSNANAAKYALAYASQRKIR